MSDNVADALAEAREWLETNGWGKGEFCLSEYVGQLDDDGCVPTFASADDYEVHGYCAVGGLIYSQEIDEYKIAVTPVVFGAIYTLANSLGLDTHPTNKCPHKNAAAGNCSCVINAITDWNDKDERTKQEVLDAFAKAEKIERAGFDPDS